uniref:DUF4150 domain-containing protein n=1 Tax=Strongyloides papillosus TaxID=174720 RepID=A0A0N5BYG2_STREA
MSSGKKHTTSTCGPMGNKNVIAVPGVTKVSTQKSQSAGTVKGEFHVSYAYQYSHGSKSTVVHHTTSKSSGKSAGNSSKSSSGKHK